jgi:hypothetical protein
MGAASLQRTPIFLHCFRVEPVLAELGDFFVEVGEGGFEGLAMIRVRGRTKIVHDARSRQLQILAFLLALELFWRFRLRTRLLPRGLRRCHLGFDVLAFPPTCHAYSLTQNARIARNQEKKSYECAIRQCLRGDSQTAYGSAKRNTVGAPEFLSTQNPDGRPDMTPMYCLPSIS